MTDPEPPVERVGGAHRRDVDEVQQELTAHRLPLLVAEGRAIEETVAVGGKKVGVRVEYETVKARLEGVGRMPTGDLAAVFDKDRQAGQ